jgi:murein DD-endopeptidase MepM/ murein hydrolase activator NlpD
MAWPQATTRVTARAKRREQLRRKARRERRLAALAVFACVLIVIVALSAFGTGDSAGDSATPAGPAPAGRLLPSGPPQPEVVAARESLRLLLPVNQNRVTAIGYHSGADGALALDPLGTQANAGLFARIARKLFGSSGSDLRYYVIEGGSGPSTSGLDVGAPTSTDVYAPVDGTVIAVTDKIVDGQAYGASVDIQPSGNPDLVVSLSDLTPDPALTVGSAVSSARTKVGRIIDLSSVEKAGLARYTQDRGQHVHVEVHQSASLASP